MAGTLTNGTVVNYFMPMEINGIPVRVFGYDLLFNNAGTIKLEGKALYRLYMPGTIIRQDGESPYLEGVHKFMKIYYCGEVIDLYKIYPNDSGPYILYYYVPA